jgi:hypothetical protein
VATGGDPPRPTGTRSEANSAAILPWRHGDLDASTLSRASWTEACTISGGDGSAWGPSHTAWDALGGEILGSPAAISWGRGRLDIVIRGLASTFWHKCWDGQQWLPGKPSWLPLLGKSYNRAVLASWGPGRLDVFVRGLDTGVYTKSLNELIWSAPV